mmetsp:Transcript_10401/g.25035  ORF Transcript_10401/g.25035 Transcript_10401/m.25035 type:complete len:400 (+) Transcript_10401:1413-2612(+)
MAVRVAWHASGTYDAKDSSGGSNGGTMRFEPERSDPANAGLFIIHDLLERVKQRFPDVSYADLWTLAGCKAVEWMGGPAVPHSLGRKDFADGSLCPAHGRLPDASQGASHLRAIFHRMGFSDRDIVALSGAHTVGRCHFVRSGFDGAWTTQPLSFDNEYFRNLVGRKWIERKWKGNRQFTDAETQSLTMLPTDIALIEDPVFRPIVEEYARDQDAFFRDFASAFSRLNCLGCPEEAKPKQMCPKALEKERFNHEFRELAMHGQLEHMLQMKEAAGDKLDLQSVDTASGRSALHKAAFWGHNHVVKMLLANGSPVNKVDFAGDSALHDAARFGHKSIVVSLLEAGADLTLKNKDGLTAKAIAEEHGKTAVVELLERCAAKDMEAAALARRRGFIGSSREF